MRHLRYLRFSSANDAAARPHKSEAGVIVVQLIEDAINAPREVRKRFERVTVAGGKPANNDIAERGSRNQRRVKSRAAGYYCYYYVTVIDRQNFPRTRGESEAAVLCESASGVGGQRAAFTLY